MIFGCKRCGYETDQKCILKRHLEKKYICSAKFNDISREELIKELHVRYIPPDDKNFTCICGNKYNQASALTRHKKSCSITLGIAKYIPTEYAPDQTTQDPEIKILLNTILDLQRQILVQKSQPTNQKEIDKINVKLLSLQIKKREQFFQKLLENHYGARHKKLKSGVTDITTDDFHGEIKIWDMWKHALGQLMCYNAENEKHEMRVYLFGSCDSTKKITIIERFKSFDIRVFYFEEDEYDVYLMEHGIDEKVSVFTKMDQEL